MIGRSWKKSTKAGGRVEQAGYMEARQRQDYRAAAESSGGRNPEVPLLSRLRGQRAELSSVGWNDKAKELVRSHPNW